VPLGVFQLLCTDCTKLMDLQIRSLDLISFCEAY